MRGNLVWPPTQTYKATVETHSLSEEEHFKHTPCLDSPGRLVLNSLEYPFGFDFVFIYLCVFMYLYFSLFVNILSYSYSY